MGGVFPDARTLDQFWDIVHRGIDTSRVVPASRWVLRPDSIHNTTPGTADRVYTLRGCFVDPFEPLLADLDLPAGLVETLDPVFHLLLEAGRNAFASARTERVDRNRVGVILGNIALPTTACSAWCERLLTPLLERKALGRASQPPASRISPLNRYVSGLPAGMLARALGLGGGSCTLDAACASSLYALKLACDELQAGRADAMLAGGLSRPDSLYTQMGFCQLRALSQSGRCTPFDAAASGLIVGEGAGVVVLKRLDDALRDGDQIQALIRGIGLSNDLDGNLLSPSSEGQLRALKLAYEQARWSPEMVDLIECHATGTPVGDAVEFESLSKLWSGHPWSPGQCVLGAVKSNIGHLLTAAGSAGLIKILLAFRNGALPSMANFQTPAEKIHLANSPFRILKQSEPWQRRAGGIPRRAAINGFGFGGINAHVLIEEWTEESASRPARSRPIRPSCPVAIVGMAAIVGHWPSLRTFQERVLGGGPLEQPSQRPEWRGIPAGELAALLDRGTPFFPGYYLDDLAIPMSRYRIPPKELAELLPQQALMLEAARSALDDAHTRPPDPARAGVFIGLGLDLRTTDFHFRWAMLDQVAGWAEDFDSDGPAKADWILQAREASGPALTPDRTMGALAGVSASRIAKEFHFGGPSHTICSEDSSGIRALEIAVRALQQGEVDQAMAGAVDLTGDLRTLSATDAVRPYSKGGVARPFDTAADGPVPGEGAVALVLKRLADAQRDGDRIYAVVRGMGCAGGRGVGGEGCVAEDYRRALERAYEEAHVDPASIQFVEANGGGQPKEDRMEAAVLGAFFGSASRAVGCRVSSAKADVGHTGAASGLVSVVKASLALYHEIIPPLRELRQPLPEFRLGGSLQAPTSPHYWVRNRADGPRRAGVSSLSVDGNCVHAVLEACEDQDPDRLAVERRQPLGARSEALFTFAANDPSGLVGQFETLRALVTSAAVAPVEILGRRWWRLRSAEAAGPCRLALVAQDTTQLLRLLDLASAAVLKGETQPATAEGRDPSRDRERLFYAPSSTGTRGGIAFVFPGSGSHFAEMGRELALEWPEILRTQDRENQFLASQMFVDRFWNPAPEGSQAIDHRALICGQVTLGTMVSDLAVYFGIKPDAVLGYSLGESTGLFALRAWSGRDDMLRRVTQSTLFTRDLVGDPEVLGRVWKVLTGQSVAWKAGLVDRPADVVRAAIAGRERIYVLIVNTPGECVVGGDAAEVEALVRRLGCHWFPLDGVSTVHCELLLPVEKQYRELHLFDTAAPSGVRFYSGAWGRAYNPDRETAADAIASQAGACVDFPKVVWAAYDSGARIFLEMGPGNSCTRMIGRILEGRPHMAKSLCASAQEPLLGVLRALGHLVAEGVDVDLERLYGGAAWLDAEEKPGLQAEGKRVLIPITGAPFLSPPPLLPRKGEHAEPPPLPPRPAPLPRGITEPSPSTSQPLAGPMDPFEADLFKSMAATQAATLDAHQAYLGFSQGLFATLSKTVESQLGLISSLAAGGPEAAAAAFSEASEALGVTPAGNPPALDRYACLEFARGSVSAVLGKDFSEVDSFPTRVRLPDEPLMLVDRILHIEGEARSMTHGRVVTEHDIHSDSWYLDGGRIPTCIAVEAGQADLFLSGYLGIDFQTRGLAVYRLLDAKVCFHQSLPQAGSVIHYDIRIERFFRQAATWLFRFSFEATVDGEPLLTMTEGCAGFFTAADLASGRGIVRTAMDLQPVPGKRAVDWEEFVPMGIESYSADQLEALRAGDFAECFGPRFANLRFNRPAVPPAGLMKLVHRIAHLDPAGGRFGLGLIRGEADIHPGDWFLTCHFVDDRVMPGTLMFECCLHTLRIFLLRLGWIVEQDQTALEPVPGVVSQLKCRGQVVETTALVTYEVAIKELGYRPEPYVIADALMYADGKPIVEVTNMSLRYAGVTREMLLETWQAASAPKAKHAIFGRDRILAFAIGKPSDAFGPPYQVFDEQRRIARLPGPPFQFMDRVTEIQAEAFKMVSGGTVEADYDVPPDAWYFAQNRQGDMPFAILLEIALQPCGWLAAYVGSALTSETDLSFRNLGGTGVQFAPVFPSTGTLTTRVKMTRVSSSAGMIIQWFDFEVRAGRKVLYQGDTYFGFFPKAALQRQEGLQNAALYQPSPEESARGKSIEYPAQAPFPGDRLRMVDTIALFLPEGGPKGLGFIRATKEVKPEEWFFKAHFYQDPVVPGSLGLESFLQLLKFLAIQRWGLREASRWEAVAMDEKHEWIYRGQIVPSDHMITVEAVVTAVNDQDRLLKADGFLLVDGRVIYAMKDFAVREQRHDAGSFMDPGADAGA